MVWILNKLLPVGVSTNQDAWWVPQRNICSALKNFSGTSSPIFLHLNQLCLWHDDSFYLRRPHLIPGSPIGERKLEIGPFRNWDYLSCHVHPKTNHFSQIKTLVHRPIGLFRINNPGPHPLSLIRPRSRHVTSPVTAEILTGKPCVPQLAHVRLKSHTCPKYLRFCIPYLIRK